MWTLGCRWLGRDPETGTAQEAWTGLPLDPAAVTAEPRRYGLHATLKAPFRLADGLDAGQLDAALGDLARRLAPVSGPPLALRAIGRFLALVPDGPAPGVDALAGAVVTALDPLRAPPTAEERARRLAGPLTEHERRLYETWGYPYVLDRFRFHVTLSDALPEAERQAVADVLAPVIAPALGEPLAISEVALFVEPPGEPFRLQRRVALG